MIKIFPKLMFFLIAAISLLANQARAQEAATAEALNTKAKHAQEVKDLIKKYQDYGQFNGAVLVAEDGEVILRQGYGMANMEWEIPNQPSTKFRIGSVTKQFTAALIMQLVEEGKIKVEEPMTTYLPEYRKDTGDKVTVHQLLNHTSGIPSYTTPQFFSEKSRDSYAVDEFVKQFASGDLEFEPGSEFRYNNSGYHLLGAIIESVTRKTYAEVLKERILDRVGMADSGYDVSGTILKNRAQGYQKTRDGYQNADYLDMGIPYAAGSMYSTVDDMFKWDRALKTNAVLSTESKALMFKPGLRDYGYGFDIEELEIGDSGATTKAVHHGGGINGFNCFFFRVVGQNHAIVLLDNVGMGQFQGAMAKSIVKILNDQPFDLPKKLIADEIFKLATEESGAAAVAKYRMLKAEQPDVFDFKNEEALNGLGYQLLGSDKDKDAIELFKLNVEMFPESSNPYDSLGEAYLKSGEKELALKNYKKSVEIDPKSQGGVLAIQKIEGKAVKIDPATLEALVGEYQLSVGLKITISVEDGVLMGEPAGQAKSALEPVSESTFLVPSVKAEVAFNKDESGKVTGMTLKQGGQEIKGEKIK